MLEHVINSQSCKGQGKLPPTKIRMPNQGQHLIAFLFCTGQIQAQRGAATCPGSHSEARTELYYNHNPDLGIPEYPHWPAPALITAG